MITPFSFAVMYGIGAIISLFLITRYLCRANRHTLTPDFTRIGLLSIGMALIWPLSVITELLRNLAKFVSYSYGRMAFHIYKTFSSNHR